MPTTGSVAFYSFPQHFQQWGRGVCLVGAQTRMPKGLACLSGPRRASNRPQPGLGLSGKPGETGPSRGIGMSFVRTTSGKYSALGSNNMDD